MSYSESEFQQLQLKHKVVTNQLDRMKTCLRQLELFCNNKLIDYLSADQSYGKINPFIQNLLKEQLFIELLAYTLIVCFPKHQYLEELKKTEKARKDRKAKKERENLLSMGDSVAITPRNKGFHDDVIILPNQAEGIFFYFFIFYNPLVNSYTSEINEDINHRKKRICELSYQLIIAVCQENIANKNYAFQYLPLFQMQAEYIPNSVDCVNMILKDNEEVLLNLHKNNATFQDHITLTSYTNNMITGASEALGKLTTNPRQESFNQKSQRLGKDVPGLRAQKRKSSSLIIANSSALAEDSYAYAYLKYYNRISKYFQSELPKVLKDWEPIKFFAALLQKTEDVEKQKKLIFFFKTISLHAGEGININQEIIHKYFTSAENASGNILSSNLVRVFTHEGKRLCVKIPFAPYKDKVYDLREFLATDDGAAEYNPTLMNSIDDSSMNMDYEMEIFDRVERRNQEILTKHLDLCAALCQSRNYSWKHILEKEITWESLLSQLVEELPSDVKASLSRLMTSLYIDQEPRREAAIPLFSKIVDKKKLGKFLKVTFLLNLFLSYDGK